MVFGFSSKMENRHRPLGGIGGIGVIVGRKCAELTTHCLASLSTVVLNFMLCKLFESQSWERGEKWFLKFQPHLEGSRTHLEGSRRIPDGNYCLGSLLLVG